MHTLDEATSRRRRIQADCAAPPLHPVLALQRGAGNQAVARAVAQRRMLARSCDPEEEAAQVADHDAHFNAIVASGQASVDAAGAVRRPAAEGPAAVVAPPPVPQGRHAPPARYRFEADEDSVVYASDEEDTEEPTPQPAIDPGILLIWPAGKVVSLGTLLMAGIPWEIILRLPLFRQPANDDADMGSDDEGEGVIRRKLARNFDPNAPRTKQSSLTKTGRAERSRSSGACHAERGTRCRRSSPITGHDAGIPLWPTAARQRPALSRRSADDRRDRRRRAPSCQLGHTNLGITSIYLHGIDRAEIIDTVHARCAPCRARQEHA